MGDCLMPIKIKSTSGSVTLDAQNVSGDQTLTVPSLSGGKTLLTTDGDGSSLTGVGVDGIVSTADATAITIDANENVGLGNTAPEAWGSAFSVLQLGGAAALWGHSLTAGYLSQNVYNDTGYKYLTTSGASLILMNGGEFKFRVAASGTADSAITWTDSLELKTDGRGLSQFTAKVWVNFNGTGTIAIRDSHNVSSLTDNGTGDSVVAFSNSMGNTDYSFQVSPSRTTGDAGVGSTNRVSGGIDGFRFETVRDNSIKVDCEYINAIIFGD
jgi:hypothetical protein